MDPRKYKIVEKAVGRVRDSTASSELTKTAVVVALSGFELHYDPEKEPHRLLLFTPARNVFVGEAEVRMPMSDSEFSRFGDEVRGGLRPDSDVDDLVDALGDVGYPVKLYEPPKRIAPPYVPPLGTNMVEEPEEKVTESSVKTAAIDEDMQKRIAMALNLTWDAIGGDVLEAVSQAPGGQRHEIPRDEVVEVVLDANYAEMYGEDAEAIEVLRSLTWEERQDVAKAAFPYETYGY